MQGERDRESGSDEVRGLRREDVDKKQTEGKRGNEKNAKTEDEGRGEEEGENEDSKTWARRYEERG